MRKAASPRPVHPFNNLPETPAVTVVPLRTLVARRTPPGEILVSQFPTAPSSPPGVSVILVNWNTRFLTEAAVKTLRTFETSTPLEIIIVDNASTDGSVDALAASLPDVRIIRNGTNEGFARANNRGVAEATQPYVLLLNTDTVAHEEVLPACLRALRASGSALVGCRLLNADGTLQVSAERFPRLRDLAGELFRGSRHVQARKLRALPGPQAGPTPVDWLCGAFLLMERHTYLRLGGLSPEIFMYGEDTEFCWRARTQGIPCLYVPNVAITHLGGGGINHASRRSLLVSDAGRLRAFALMRGRAAAALLRLILMARSASRSVGWALTGLVKQDRARLAKAGNHAHALLALAGLKRGEA